MIAKALHEVDNAESILKTKNLIALFMQTMNVSGTSPSPRLDSIQAPMLTRQTTKQTWGFSVRVFDDFLLKLFEKYAELLKRRFSDDFQEVRTFQIIRKTFQY